MKIDPRSISDKSLARLVTKEIIDLFVKRWYWLHTPPYYYGFEAYLKDVMQDKKVPIAKAGRWISILSTPSRFSANTKQEVDFLKLALAVKKLGTGSSAFNRSLRYHYNQYKYSVSAFGNEPMDLKELRRRLLEWRQRSVSFIRQRLEKFYRNFNKAKLDKQKIFKALGNQSGVRIVSDLLGGMAYLRERNKEALGKVLYVYGRLYQEVARRIDVPVWHTDYYLLSELANAVLFGKRVPLMTINQRRRCVVVLVEHNKYKKFISGKHAHALAERELREKVDTKILELHGNCGHGGYAKGAVKIIQTTKDIFKMRHGNILIASSTDHELVPAMKKAAAIVTNEGGILAHAAVISREFNIPCVIATNIATQVFRDGDKVEVDANKGVVRKV